MSSAKKNSTTNSSNSKKTSSHSFYEEAKKSMYGQEKWTKERIGRTLWKYTKWSIYAFLIIITLWGCVNEFRHPTSQYMTQGLEFYQTYDDVLPNLYSGVQTSYTYEVEGTVTQEYDDGDDYNEPITDESRSLVPLEFYVINPYYNYTPDSEDEEVSEDLNTTDLFVKSADRTTVSGYENYGALAYTVNLSTANSYLLRYDWTNYQESYLYENGIFLLKWSPDLVSDDTEYAILGITSEADYDLYDTDGDDYITSLEFLNGLIYNGTLTQDEYDILVDVDDEGVEYYAGTSAGYLYPSYYDVNSYGTLSPDTLQYVEWDVVEGISNYVPTQEEFDEMTDEEKQDLYNDQLVYLTNLFAYISGEGKWTSTTEMPNFVTVDPTDTTTVEEIMLNVYQDIDPSWTYTNYYEVDFFPLSDESLYSDSNGIIKSGIAYSIVPQSKEQPIYLSGIEDDVYGAFDDLMLARDRAWAGDTNEWWEGTSAGTSERTDNAGWAIVEYDSETEYWESVTLYSYTEPNEETILFGKNKETIYNFQTHNLEEEGFTEDDYLYNYDQNDSRFGEANYYLETSITISIGIEGYKQEITYYADFIGLMESSEAFGGSPSSGTVYGTTPRYSWEYDETTSEYYLVQENKFDDVIASSGQDPNNDNRDIFTGSASDWGDSWNPDYGPMYGIFVWPLAQLSLFVQSWFPVGAAWGVILGILIITYMLRFIGVLMSWKSQKNQQKMQEIQTQVAQIKAKYANYDKSNKQMKQKQQQEIMALYRKNDVNPFSSIGTIFITLPVFLSIWTIISAIPAYKIVSVGAFSFNVSSFYGMFNIAGFFMAYLLVGVTVGLAQGVASKMPKWLANKRNDVKRIDDATKEAMKKQTRIQNILIGVFIFIGLTVPVLLAIYWIFSASFSILLELTRHWKKEWRAKRVSEA